MVWLTLFSYCFCAFITLIAIRVYNTRTSSYEDNAELLFMCLFWPITVIVTLVVGVGLGMKFLSRPIVRTLAKGKRR